MSGCFAIYRKPDDIVCTLVGADTPAVEVKPGQSLSGSPGYLIAPFSESLSTPVLFIPADKTCTGMPEDINLPPFTPDECPTDYHPLTRDEYRRIFRRFHGSLAGDFDKLVLSRSQVITSCASPQELFVKACRKYPHAFVTLFHTARSGTWLMASPELLVECHSGHCRTMALAGTRKAGAEGEWPEKDRGEQAFVSKFIENTLSAYAEGIYISAAHTSRAGGIEHLRTDFSFSIEGDNLIPLAASLHPTPAVAGVPRDAAVRFILENEATPREYYSGFSGPLGVNGDSALFVSLRCMRLFSDCCILYAGGGIVADSREQDEWNETEAKMETMKNIL